MLDRLTAMLWPLRRSAYSIRMVVAGLVAMSGVYSFPPYQVAEYFGVSVSVISAIYFYTLAIRFRKCGHGLVCQWRFLFFPWVIDPCPKCGASSFS